LILESLVTTLDEDGAVNLAPMGPIVDDDDLDLRRFTLRPFQTTTTYRNLKANRQGVLHVTDDVLLIARAAIGRLDMASLPMRAAAVVHGLVLRDCCRYHEFRVLDLDDRDPRTTIVAETVASGRERDFFGFNRAKHAVLEAAILATRIGLIPIEQIRAELERLAIPVGKTAGRREREAFELLVAFVEESPTAEEPRG
jgi:uncharacterized protein